MRSGDQMPVDIHTHLDTGMPELLLDVSRAVSIDMLYFDVRVLDNLTIASRVMLPLPSV